MSRMYFSKRSKIIRKKCHICSSVKLTRKLFSVKFIGELVSTNLGVVKNHAARNGTCYVQTFMDYTSKYVSVYGLKKKSDAIKKLEKSINVDRVKNLGILSSITMQTMLMNW